MLPQLGKGEGTPNPRYDSPASSSMTFPMPSAAETMIGAAALGRTWRKITRVGPAPAARAAATNSRSRRLRTSARTSRRSEEHTSELQSRLHLVCRLLLEKKKTLKH